MAKRKKQKKDEKKEGFKYGRELQSLVLVLLSITGLGSFGLVGSLVKKFAIFLFGSHYYILLILTLCLGVLIIARRKELNLFSARLIGVYSIVLALLLMSHVSYIEDESLRGSAIFSKTFDNISESYQETGNPDNKYELDIAKVRNTGGGLIGATLSWTFVSLFAVEGTWIVIAIISIFGLIMLFDVTLVELGKAIITPIKNLFSRETKEREVTVHDIAPDEEEKIDNRVVITSVEDIEKNNIKETTVGAMEHVETTILPEDNKNEIYIKPPVTLLDPTKNKGKVNSKEFIDNNTKILERVFQDFGMKAKVIEAHIGPAVTQYEMDLERGTKVNKVLSISREIALALAAKEVRIEAPIPGKNTVGVEIPNQSIMSVSMREIMESIPSKLDDSKLLAPLGRDIMGKIKYVEINKTPHMLVAGATGSGKSVCINNIIVSILMRTSPEDVKMVLVDPKKVEFNVYEDIPHLLMPVVTDPKKASAALQKIVVEMDNRYEIYKNSGTKSIGTYNDYVEKKLQKDPNCGLKKMPYILVVIDELADLMLVAAKEVEESIMRITQLARAAGIHLIVATQRPSADVITGVIKANIPTRISFAVSSSIDSRTILDMTGAEKLLGKGDMLYKPMDDNTPTRVQGSFVSDDEIKRVVDFVKKRTHAPKYDEKFTNLEMSSSSGSGSLGSGSEAQKDVLYDEILNYAIRMGQISASLIQRKYSIGYNRAARIMDMFEEKGIVGPAKGSKPRDVLVKLEEPKE